MVDCLTDNRARTVAEVRHAFTKHGGNLGTDGSVAFLFKHCGQFIFAPGTNEEKLMEAALEAGAEDVLTNDDGSLEVISTPRLSRRQTALRRTVSNRSSRKRTMKAANETTMPVTMAQNATPPMRYHLTTAKMFTPPRNRRVNSAAASSWLFVAHHHLRRRCCTRLMQTVGHERRTHPYPGSILIARYRLRRYRALRPAVEHVASGCVKTENG
jgi:hypothetical protein